MVGLKAVFLKKLSMTAYAMGRYAITRRKISAGAVVPRIHARRSVVALIAGDPSPCPPPHPALSPSRGRGREGQSVSPDPPCFRMPPVPRPGQNTTSRLYHVGGGSEIMGGEAGRLLFRSTRALRRRDSGGSSLSQRLLLFPLTGGTWRCTPRSWEPFVSRSIPWLGPYQLRELSSRRGDSNGPSHQALGAPWIRGDRRDSRPRVPPHRQGGGDHRDRVVRAGVRPGRGCGVAQGRCRLREGERQQDRAEHHPLRAGTAEDHRGAHQRGR